MPPRVRNSFPTKEALLYFATKWREKYGSDYQISWGRESAQVKRVLAAIGGTLEQFKPLVDLYFSRPSDDLVRRSSHSLGVFTYKLNELRGALAVERKKDEKTEAGNPDYDRVSKLFK